MITPDQIVAINGTANEQARILAFDSDAGSDSDDGSKKIGRVVGAGNYTADEHLKMLEILSSIPNSFNSGEGSAEFKTFFQRLVAENPGYTRNITAVHDHLTELYTALKRGIPALGKTPRIPTLEEFQSDLGGYGFYYPFPIFINLFILIFCI